MNKRIRCFTVALLGLLSASSWARTVVVIDAGHGGKDPGAIGRNLNVKEKDVTLAIARELRSLLNADPNFKAVMTRNGDYFIPLPSRTEIARENKANYLVSIHADSSPSSVSMKGASVWVLSNRRASDEMGKWLEDHEKQSELLGGAGRILANTNERYLNQTVLDLQFSHAQRKGYEMGKSVLSKMSNVTSLAKSNPQHASLSVLRSPDIISILVETGFLSNAVEEQKLATSSYRKQVARAIYNGLVAYRNKNASISNSSVNTASYKESSKSENRKVETVKTETTKAESKKSSTNSTKEQKSVEKTKKNAVATKESSMKKDSAKKEQSSKNENNAKKAEKSRGKAYHIVAENETLYRIALNNGTTPEKLSELNGIKNNNIRVGQKIKLH